MSLGVKSGTDFGLVQNTVLCRNCPALIGVQSHSQFTFETSRFAMHEKDTNSHQQSKHTQKDKRL
jgi:hypothetical protein